MSLRNRTGEERRRQTLRDKRDKIFFKKNSSAELHPPLNRSCFKRPENINLVKVTTKFIRKRPVTFVKHKRSAVIFFLSPCCVKSLLSLENDLKGLEDLSLKTPDQESQYFDKTSRPPYWCPKLMRPRPYWCSKPILWERSLFLM